MTTHTPESDRAAALQWLWGRVISHIATMRLDRTGPVYELQPDDLSMRDASQDNAFGWLDDCEARLGCDVADARAALVDYMFARDGAPGAQDVAEALTAVLREASDRFHAAHPVRYGLRAMIEPPSMDA